MSHMLGLIVDTFWWKLLGSGLFISVLILTVSGLFERDIENVIESEYLSGGTQKIQFLKYGWKGFRKGA